MLLSSFEFFEVGNIRELEKLHNEDLQNSDFSPWSTIVAMKSQDDDDDDDDVCVCVCVCVCVFVWTCSTRAGKAYKTLIGNP